MCYLRCLCVYLPSPPWFCQRGGHGIPGRYDLWAEDVGILGKFVSLLVVEWSCRSGAKWCCTASPLPQGGKNKAGEEIPLSASGPKFSLPDSLMRLGFSVGRARDVRSKVPAAAATGGGKRHQE